MNQSTNYFGQHLFSQITFLCSRPTVAAAIEKTKANRYYKRLHFYEHFISMLYCVLSGCTSLREIVSGLGVAQGKLNHLGINYVPPRSTLSDGNKERSADTFKAVYEDLYQKYKPSLSDSTLPKAILQKLFLLDATVFGLFKAILKTSGRYAANGKKKGGIKKNTVIEAASLMPFFIQFDAAADSDQRIYKKLSLPAGSYIVFDKGYNNYKQFAAFTHAGIYFITRQKDNAVFKNVMECLHDDTSADNILKEAIIEQTYKDEDGQEQTLRLRRIAWWDQEKQRSFEFITNNFELDAAIIALLYKYRWKIELFFKKLKQNFPLQYFVGDNQNAIEIQIWCALIALLLLSTIHHQHQSKMAFSVFVTVVRLHLFNYIGIATLLKHYQQQRKASTKQPELFNST
ncbi:IS4 family transposase [Niabella sp.]|uniref:IS4 family transposase n=1 Tax=Niabella sp. TaxID=1962976 RepID=UPI002630CF03|nr:IS4 family transposase [Niabella sp.]